MLACLFGLVGGVAGFAITGVLVAVLIVWALDPGPDGFPAQALTGMLALFVGGLAAAIGAGAGAIWGIELAFRRTGPPKRST
jgi:hypothetical protein